MMKNQRRITRAALIITFILAAVSIAGTLTGHFQMWPALTSLGLHGMWIAIAYRKRVKVSKTGLEFEDDEEGESK